MKSFFIHIKTIMSHRRAVRKACFKMGIPIRGILHDISKFSPREFLIFKYATGKRSPHAIMRDAEGFSNRWMCHYHRNKHHWQYWLDIESYPGGVNAIKMPYKYVTEMFCDFIGAGKVYQRNKWTVKSPYQYWKSDCERKRLMHKNSEALFVYLTKKLSKSTSEKEFYENYKKEKAALTRSYKNGTFLKDYEQGFFTKY